MGEAPKARGVSNAAGGRAARRMALRSALKGFWRNDDGATAIEYGLIVACVVLVMIAALSAFGSTTTGTFEYIEEKIGGALTPSPEAP